MNEQKLIDWAAGQVAIGGMIGAMIEQKMASYNAGDEFAHLEPRLANHLREADVKPLKVETIPEFWDDLSGDHYCNRAIFNKDGSVDVVSYKGEGEAYFETVEEYNQYLESLRNRNYDPCPDYNDYE